MIIARDEKITMTQERFKHRKLRLLLFNSADGLDVGEKMSTIGGGEDVAGEHGRIVHEVIVQDVETPQVRCFGCDHFELRLFL